MATFLLSACKKSCVNHSELISNAQTLGRASLCSTAEGRTVGRMAGRTPAQKGWQLWQ